MSILDVAAPIITKLLNFIPDPQQKAAAQLELFKAQQAGEFKELDLQAASEKAQTDINLEDAKGSGFKANARPLLMYVGTIGVAVQWVVVPTASYVYTLWTGHDVPVKLPPLDSNLYLMLTGLLGIHIGARSYEKVKGVA